MKSFIGIEEWRDIAGYEGYYQVSNFGKVRSVDRYVKCKGFNYIEGRIMKPNMDKYGYFKILLCKNNKYKTFTIHRLVGMTFPDLVDWTEEAKGKPFEELEINHKNECKWDNAVWNLEWCNSKYNINYGTGIKRRIETQRKTMSTMKPILQYTLDMEFVAEYPSASEASRKTGINKSNISSCCNGNPEHKSAGGYVWKRI